MNRKIILEIEYDNYKGFQHYILRKLYLKQIRWIAIQVSDGKWKFYPRSQLTQT